MDNKRLLSEIDRGVLKSNEVFIPNIFNALKIENADTLSQDELDKQLKTYLCQNNRLLQTLKLPKSQDGSQSYGQLNKDGSVSVGVELKNGKHASMEDYYKQYPWNKPGLSGKERTELFNNRPTSPFLQAPPDSPVVDYNPSSTVQISSATSLKPNDSAPEEQQEIDVLPQRNTPN